MNSENALLIFAKAPREGSVKTRLQPEISPKDALRLYKAMVDDLITQIEDETQFDPYIFYWPPDAEAELTEWLGDHFRYVPQHQGDLGQKMHRAFDHIFRKEYNNVVIVGCDIPMLTREIIDEAFTKLHENDMILGPSTDGGYYLIGLKGSQPNLFQDISWSTNLVRKQTLRQAQHAGLKVHLTRELNDIDVYPDVLLLYRELNVNGHSHLKKTMDVLNIISNYSTSKSPILKG